MNAETTSTAALRSRFPANLGYLSEPGLWKTVLANFFLSVFTLGVYRFWARTRIRRYFWKNITIAGDPLEYTGRGSEIFIGFLIVLAVLAPVAVVYYGLQRVLQGNVAASLALRVTYVLILFALIHIAVFRARRYRLTRTRWRGIRAGQTGSAKRYLGLSVLYSLLTLATLGLAAPWMTVALERYKMNNTWFGNCQFRLEASGARLFSRWLTALLLCFAPIIVAVATNWTWIIAASHATPGSSIGSPPHPAFFALFLLAFFVGFPVLLWYRIAMFRYLAGSVRLGDMRLKSEARTLPILGYLIVYLLGLLLLVLLFATVASLVASGFVMGAIASDNSANIMQAAELIIYFMVPVVLLVFFPLFLILNYCWLQVSLVRHFTTTLSVENIGELDRIAQSAREDPRFGEGLADAFDVDVGVV